MSRYLSKDHSACGVGMIINISPRHSNKNKSKAKASRQIVDDGLKTLADYEYRSAPNPVTEESDGSGICIHGLPAPFFQEKINKGAFTTSDGTPLSTTLDDNQFGIGQYFLPTKNTKLKKKSKSIN